jgi:alkanesulfonate monooxygenase SsuD/methylene tetrahydromethanopterin reductase-like flavin-dependent oxidoreductase (luciferase family)
LRTPRLAARFADEFNVLPSTTLEDARTVLERIDRACEAEGRDPASLRRSAAVTVCCATTPAEVQRRIAATGRDPEALRRAGAVGTPAQVVERLAPYPSLGVQTVYLQMYGMEDLDHLALVAAEVLPSL